MSKVLLDGYGLKLKAIRGFPDHTCPDIKEDGFSKIIIETNKGEFSIIGCSECYVLKFKDKPSSGGSAE